MKKGEAFIEPQKQRSWILFEHQHHIVFVVEQLADEFAGKLKVGKVDVDQAPGVASKYGIRSVPTVMVFEGGQKKAQHIGLTKREKLLELAGLR